MSYCQYDKISQHYKYMQGVLANGHTLSLDTMYNYVLNIIFTMLS